MSGARFDALARVVVDRTVEIASVPAPTGDEAARAAVVAGWWRTDGWAGVGTDACGNVHALARPGASPAVVLAAHLDTVFPAELPHAVHRNDARLVGPSVGDDAVALAALSAVGTLLAEGGGDDAGGDPRGEGPGRPVHLLATTGEEGLGNLRGITAALDAWPAAAPIGALLAVEGNYLGRVSAVGVGSARWRVRLTGPGGHAWEAASAPSAVHAAAEAIAGLAGLAAPGTSVNVGRIEGGEAVNARARACRFDLDLRADDPEALAALEAEARATIAGRVPPGIETAIEEVGRRPAGALDSTHPLVRAAVDALADAGIAAELVATSTDANAAHARGIPAVAVGITTGGGEHTPEEWIDLAPIASGLSALASTVTRFEEATR